MLDSLLSGLLLSASDMAIVGRVPEGQHFTAAIEATGPDVAIIGGQTGEWAQSLNDTLFSHPRLKLLLITAAAQDGYVCELKPRLTQLQELSATALLGAIRDGNGMAGAARRAGTDEHA